MVSCAKWRNGSFGIYFSRGCLVYETMGSLAVPGVGDGASDYLALDGRVVAISHIFTPVIFDLFHSFLQNDGQQPLNYSFRILR